MSLRLFLWLSLWLELSQDRRVRIHLSQCLSPLTRFPPWRSGDNFGMSSFPNIGLAVIQRICFHQVCRYKKVSSGVHQHSISSLTSKTSRGSHWTSPLPRERVQPPRFRPPKLSKPCQDMFKDHKVSQCRRLYRKPSSLRSVIQLTQHCSASVGPQGTRWETTLFCQAKHSWLEECVRHLDRYFAQEHQQGW